MPALHEVSKAAGLPAGVSVRQGVWQAPHLRLAGTDLAQARLAYTTVGEPDGEPVLVLHGTNGSGAALMTPAFAGALFGPGQPLDARHYFIVLPDAVGCGGSIKPSDGLGETFPPYGYQDLVQAQHRLVTEHLGLTHLRLVLGHSMGGMHTWLWAQTFPDFLDIAVPMACQPAALCGRNWMLRRLLIDAIRRDPAQWRAASLFFNVATNGGDLALRAAGPDGPSADAWLAAQAEAAPAGHPLDHCYQWEASRDYDPVAGLSRIACQVLAINAADDERNPPALGTVDAVISQLPRARHHLIPASAFTSGHATTTQAHHWAAALAEALRTAPRRAP